MIMFSQICISKDWRKYDSENQVDMKNPNPNYTGKKIAVKYRSKYIFAFSVVHMKAYQGFKPEKRKK